MRFRLVVDGEARNIEVDRTPQGIRVRVDGVEYRGHARRLEDGVAVRIGSRWHRIRFEGRKAVFYDEAHVIGISEIEEKSADQAADSVTRGTRLVEIRAPMAGRVARVFAQAGSRVRRGETLLVLEAMKMQNEIPAPRDGIVREVRVVEGESITVDGILVVLERG